MSLKSLSVMLLSLIALVSSPFALAHSGSGHASGLADGFMHIATGVDHLLVFVIAGYWAGRSGNHGISDIGFVLATLLAGMLLGVCCHQFPQLPLPTVLAVLLTTGFIALAIATPRYYAYLIFGGFALYHGIVHMLVMPVAAIPAGFIIGLLFSTALLLMCGLILRQVIITRKPHSQPYS